MKRILSDFDRDQILKMKSKRGFISMFWDVLRDARKDRPETTHEDVFDFLNWKYMELTGKPRYSCYTSFKQRLNK